MFTFTGLILKEDHGYSSLCPDLDVASMGTTPQEAKAMLLEAAALHMEGSIEDGLPYLRPVPHDDDPRQITPDRIVEIFRFRVDVAVHSYAWPSYFEASPGNCCSGEGWFRARTPKGEPSTIAARKSLCHCTRPSR